MSNPSASSDVSHSNDDLEALKLVAPSLQQNESNIPAISTNDANTATTALEVPATTFPKFSKLAPELQLMIWHTAAARPQIVTFQRSMRDKEHKHDSIRTTSYPALYDACQLSRQALVEKGTHQITQALRFQDFNRRNLMSLNSGNPALSSRGVDAPRAIWFPPSYMMSPTQDTVYIWKDGKDEDDQPNMCPWGSIYRARGGMDFWGRLKAPRIAMRFDFRHGFRTMLEPNPSFPDDSLINDEDLLWLVIFGDCQEIILVHSSKGMSTAEADQQEAQAKQELKLLEKYLDNVTRSPKEFDWKAPKVLSMSEEELLAGF